MKRGIEARRAVRARSNDTLSGRRATTWRSAILICVLLASVGTAAIWAVERGVVTSASSDPARVGTSQPPAVVPPPVVVPPLAQDSTAASPPGPASPPAPSSQPTRVRIPASRNGTTDIDLEFWVEWGGGEPRAWFGTLRLDRGRIKTARGHGLLADAPGATFLEDNLVTISPRLPRSFDSVLVQVRAPRDANLQVSYVANGATSAGFEAEIPLQDILQTTQHRRLDEHDNKLIIRRTKSDSLRIQSARASMVFEPNELFEFSVLPNAVDCTQAQPQCRVELQPARSDATLWFDQHAAARRADGSILPAGPFQLIMPRQEGVYDLLLTLEGTGRWRRVQVVVASSGTSAGEVAEVGTNDKPTPRFQVAEVLDPANPMKPLATNPNATLFHVRETPRHPTSHGQVAPVRRFDQDLVEIESDGWLALPVPVTQPGQPHVLEIEYPNDSLQTLGIAIHEPGSPRPTLDTGLKTSVVSSAAKPGLVTYRVTFWPRTTAPTLILANRDAEHAAATGPIRVFAGADRLPESGNRPPPNGRLLAAHLDTASFPELFSATLRVDPESGRQLHDWVTFFEGAQRLIEVLKYRGYNGAVVPVLSDGGSLYPSPLLEPTPLYDDGIFFATSQDPTHKDVLEMLLRMFDREGLRLVPSVKFTGTLPALEALRRRGDRPSIHLVNSAGQRWRPDADSLGAGTHYNPLDEEVQAAMSDVVAELAARYAAHNSFAGIAIDLAANSYATLPGPDWGADPATRKRFDAARDATSTPAIDAGRLHQAWLSWRAERLTEMYAKMNRNLGSHADEARLYLLGSAIHETAIAAKVREGEVAPSGLTAGSALLALGLDTESLREQGIVFLAPRQPTVVETGQIDLDHAWDRDYTLLFGEHAGRVTGSLLDYPTQEFDTRTHANQLPIQNLMAATRTQLAAAGPRSRQGLAHALASLDSRAVFDGAWQSPSDERLWRDMAIAYRRLPDLPFDTVSPPVGSKTQPVVIRRAKSDDKTIFYLVNDSPRPVGTRIGLGGDPALKLKSISTTALPPLEKTEHGTSLLFVLRPYQLVAFEASLPDTTVVAWETLVDPQVVADLRRQLERLEGSVTARREYPRLTNSDFDQVTTSQDVPGWVFGQGEGMNVQIDADTSRHGTQALHLSSETPAGWSSGPVVWLRSAWFAPPASGRLAFGGWLKTRDFGQQPHVRLLVEGRLPNDTLVRRERVFGVARNEPDTLPLGADWEYHTVLAEGLPADIEEIRVGIDLRGTGDVWVDHVAIHDVWLNEQEQHGLQRDIGIATEMLQAGRISDVQHLLNSPYAQYVFANLEPLAKDEPVPPAASPVSEAIQQPPAVTAPPSLDTPATPDLLANPVPSETSIASEVPVAPDAPVTPEASSLPDTPVTRGVTETIGDTPPGAERDSPFPVGAYPAQTSPNVATSSSANGPVGTGTRSAQTPRTLEAFGDEPRPLRHASESGNPLAEPRPDNPSPGPSARSSRFPAGRTAASGDSRVAPSRTTSAATRRPETIDTSATPAATEARAEPESWLDKIKNFKFKLPERPAPPPRTQRSHASRSMFGWLDGSE